jgi:stage V sporulation protein B
MNKSSSKKNNFIFQAGLLAAAGIIVKIIGILYRAPLVMIIGDEGNGYYNTAYNIYTIILMISTYSIPAAISKVMAAKLGLNEYRNAFRLFIGALVYVLVMGLAGCSVCFFFADSLVGPSSAQVLKYFAPTIFFSGFLGTFRGFFQAQHTMVYTSVSQIIEQIFNAAVSIGAALIFTRSLRGLDETVIAIGGAKGSALGTGAGVVSALVFMLVIYLIKRKGIKDKVKNDPTENILKPTEVAGMIFGMVTPVLLSTCIYNLSSVTNLKLYQELSMAFKGYTEKMATYGYGLFSGKSTQIVNIPIALAAAMSSAIIPAVSRTHERGEYEEGRQKIAMATKATMLIAIPCAFGLFALARSITVILYPQPDTVEMVASMIRVLSVTVIFYCLSTLSNGILQGTGHVHIPVINAAVALLAQSVVATLLILFTNLDLYAICISTIVYSGLMCVLNGHALKKKCGYKQEYIRTFILPITASLWMGILAFLTNKVITWVFRLFDPSVGTGLWGMRNAISLIICVIVSVLFYAVLILHYGVATKEELLAMPKGGTIVKICVKLHLLKDEDIITRRRKGRNKD